MEEIGELAAALRESPRRKDRQGVCGRACVARDHRERCWHQSDRSRACQVRPGLRAASRWFVCVLMRRNRSFLRKYLTQEFSIPARKLMISEPSAWSVYLLET